MIQIIIGVVLLGILQSMFEFLPEITDISEEIKKYKSKLEMNVNPKKESPTTPSRRKIELMKDRKYLVNTLNELR